MKSIKSLTALLLCCLMILTAPVAAIGQTAVDGVVDTPTAEKSAVLEDTVIDVAGVPVDTEVVANAVEEDEYDDGIYTHLDNSSEILFAYDISMEKEDGTEWQPEEGETVTISVDTTSLAVPEGSRVKVLHEHNGEIKPIEGEYKVVDNKISFETTGFSKFYFYLTFASGDKVFTLGGYDSIYLSELMTSLELEQSITDVVDVVFSNTSYVSVTKDGDDWLLKSLKPFGTEEYLNIYFADGTVLGIKVTDPILYYYLKDTNWAMATFESKVTSKGTEWEAPAGVVTINKDAIVGATLGATETDNAKLDVIIYAHPGMAIRFDRYSDFREISSKPISEGSGNSIYSNKPYHVSKDGLWRWVWGQDSSGPDATGYNYIVLKDDITEVTETNTFYVSLGDRNDANHDSNSEYVECAIKIVIVPDLKPEPQLLKDALAESKFKDKYVIKQLNVNLYDYDGAAFNAKYSGDHLSFRGSTINANGDYAAVKADGFGENGQMNGGGNEGSKMGIVKSQVGSDGLPVIAAGTNVDLFSDNEFDGKTVYADVPFDFIYEPATGYYTYSSNLNHAQFDEESYKVNLYHGGLGTTASYALNGQSANYSYGGFYPFVDINDAVYGGGDFLDWDLWEDRIINGYIKAPVPYAADLVTSTAEGTTVNNHNGLYVSERFYLPEDKKNENGDDIVYQFTGDDDLWVFIDGELVLDIGGGHFPIDGEINFTKGTVHVRNSEVENGGYYYDNGAGWTKDDFYNDKYEIKGGEFHTLQVFYLERYAGVSNCRMRFNIPIVPTNAVTVSKNLRNQDDEKLTVTPDEEYKFVLYTAAGEDNNIDAKEGSFSALKNAPYTVTGVGAPMDVQHTNPRTGEFTLKDGWSATFEGIDIFTEVYAKELAPNEDYNYIESTVSVDKATAVDYNYGDKTETKVMKLDSAITFDFKNFIETQPLSIEKEVIGGELGLIDGNQEFEFTLDFTKAIIEDGEGEIVASDKDGEDVSLTDAAPFNLSHGDKLTFAKVPVNMTYTLKETNPDAVVDARNGDGSFDDPIFEHKVGNADSVNTTMEFGELFEKAIQTDDGSSEPVENAIKVINQQRFDLNVKKLGISDLDNHDDKGDGFNKEERQSTIYRVVGKRGDEVIADMNITLHGNTESLIKGLPVGEYTVTELTDWSWRYEPAGDAEKSVIIPADAEAEVEYTNVRVIENWLSGDSYAENWWGGGLLNKIMNLANSASGDN